MRRNNRVIKYMILISIFIFSEVVYGKCLNKDVAEYVASYVGSNKYAHGNELEIIPNYFKCINPLHRLEKYVCKDKQLLNMFQLLARARINFWERNERHKVDHKSFNDDDIKLWVEKYNTDNLSNVCFDLQKQTTGYLGGLSPYKEVEINNRQGEVLFVKENEHGLSLQLHNKIVYMGTSCDVIDSLGRKGKWYKSDNKYIIKLGDEFIKFNTIKNNIINNKCSKKSESDPLTVVPLKSIEITKEAVDLAPKAT